MTSSQSRLYAYILSLVFDSGQADDILQQTNAILWEKEADFAPGTNFIAWSFRIAYFQVSAHRKKQQRERLVFDDGLLNNIAQVANQMDETFETRRRHLHQCLEKLNNRQRDFIRRRYSAGATLKKLATEASLTVNAAKQLLFRARNALIQCVNVQIDREATQ